MAKKRRKPISPAGPSESRAAEALTVGWLLAVMTAGMCEVGSAIALALRHLGSGMELAAGYLLFAAAVIGTASLLLAAGVFCARSVPPPRGVSVVGLAIGAVPLIVLLLRGWR
jgi:hypothetical protein